MPISLRAHDILSIKKLILFVNSLLVTNVQNIYIFWFQRMVAVLEDSDWTNVSVNNRPAAVISDDSAYLARKESKELQVFLSNFI